MFFQLNPARRHVLGRSKIADIAASIGLAQFGFFGPHFITDILLLADNRAILIGTFGADGGGAFEHHVLKKMRGAGDAGTLVRGPYMGNPSSGDIRFVLALNH